MRALRFLLKFYSYAVNAVVALAALAMSAVILQTPDHAVRIGWLTWTDDVLGSWLAGLGVSPRDLRTTLSGREHLSLELGSARGRNFIGSPAEAS